MTTTLERLDTEPKHDPTILLPNVWSDLQHLVVVLCPCGSTASVDARKGTLSTHEPKSEWTLDGQRRAVIRDAFGIGFTCRYSGRTATLDAALAHDSALTPAEQHVRDRTQRLLEAGIVFTAPEGYALPKVVASLFALAEASGWTTAQSWTPYEDGFTLNLRVGRASDDGRSWQYDLSWFCAPGVARRTRFGLSRSPDRRGVYDTPSVKAIRGIISANPVPEKG
ncbi:hypothetical protein [Streptomyces sp. NPDC051572]|jgi:hypothetical protein|uniref:hypothetical protein n=1 Tax=Streptomyces sp. NPDC051572 TaxID=3155802 RepID=UPI00344E6425